MASLVQGFEYDIFISYRQKDNKGDKWVSEFVESLKTELDSTFKENISVFFDVNPHDGLLETYDVDASLKKKLKCLVFIPIISRTYCDPNSFAWEHEFKTFASQALSDRFGLKINLPNGHVMNRILPVRIHDIDSDDIKLCESIIGGALRGVEFVYKTSGVNRPLRATEEHAHDNFNKTYYRDQINKVANAIREIISALKKTDLHNPVTQEINITVKKNRSKKTIYFVPIMAVSILLLLYFLIPSASSSTENLEKNIAVIPFEKWFTNKDYLYLGDALASQINSALRAVSAFNVISFNSTRHYQIPNIPKTRVIGKECGANIIVQGSVELLNTDKDVSINVQLINATNEKTIWEKYFNGELDSLQSIRSKIIFGIAEVLKVKLTQDETEHIQSDVTKSSNAYKNFLSGNYQAEASALAIMGKNYQDSTSYELAIKMYDKAIKYDSLFAMAYARRALSRSLAALSGYLRDKINSEKCRDDAEKAIKLDPKLAEAYNAFGLYYYSYKADFQNALDFFKKSSELDPGNWQPLFYSAVVYRRMGEWSKSQALMTKVLKHNPQDALVLTNIGMSYCYLKIYDTAVFYNNEAIKIMPNWNSPYINKYYSVLLGTGDIREVRSLIDTAVKYTGDRFHKEKVMLDIYDRNFNAALFKTELSEQDDFENQGEKLLLYGTIYEYLKRNDLAKSYYDSALVFFEKRLKTIETFSYYIQRGYAYAGLKDYQKAIKSARKGIDLIDNQMSKSYYLISLAEIYIKCGDFKNGIKILDELLKNPSMMSVNLLLLDPVWDPVKNDPEFSMLLNKYSKNE